LERRFDNRAGGFITGIDVFGKEEQARLIERAKRFGLDPANTHVLSEKELKKLYWRWDTLQDFVNLNFQTIFTLLPMFAVLERTKKIVTRFFVLTL